MSLRREARREKSEHLDFTYLIDEKTERKIEWMRQRWSMWINAATRTAAAGSPFVVVKPRGGEIKYNEMWRQMLTSSRVSGAILTIPES